MLPVVCAPADAATATQDQCGDGSGHSCAPPGSCAPGLPRARFTWGELTYVSHATPVVLLTQPNLVLERVRLRTFPTIAGMARFRVVAGFAVALTVWVAAVTWTRAQSVAPPGSASPSAAQTSVRGAVPAATCAKCHASIHQQWLGARHSKMLQPATPATVLAPFSGRSIELRGTAFTLTHEGDRYFIRGPFPTAKEEVHRVEYTLGSRRVQHYLARLPDGRLVVLPPAWDVQKGEWFHNLDIVNPDDVAGTRFRSGTGPATAVTSQGSEKGFDQRA